MDIKEMEKKVADLLIAAKKDVDYFNNDGEFDPNPYWLAENIVKLFTIPVVSNRMVDVKWQTRDEMDSPTNPLQKLQEVFAFTSLDCSKDKMIAFLYAVISGWDDASYAELKVKHNWSDEDVKMQKDWHIEYKKAWNIYMDVVANEA